MTVWEYQEKIVETIERYGRPKTTAQHMRKLGEEVGELAEAVACNNSREIVAECMDVINVATSLMDLMGGSFLDEANQKIRTLNVRMAEGRFDKRFGPQPTKYGV